MAPDDAICAVRIDATWSTRSARPRPRAGLSAALCTVSFIAFTSAVVCGLRAMTGDDRHELWLRFGGALAATAVLGVWTFVRLRAARDVNRTLAPPPEPPYSAVRARKAWRRRALPMLGLVLLGAGVWSVAGEWSGAQAALAQLAHPRWMPVRWAIYAEAVAVVSLALVSWILLRASGRRLTPGSVLGITLAGNALASSLPGGAAVAAAFSFDQLRRREVSRGVAVWVLLVTLGLSAVALLALLIVGTIVAGGQGPAAPAWPLALAVPVAVGVALAVIARRPRARRWLAEVTAVACPRRVLAGGFAAATLNWIADCACFAASIAAVSGHVPWQGLLVIYALTQVSQAIPLTPGGLGVVEGAASLLLIAYGMPTATAVAAVLVYRIISFWALLPIGWGAAGALLLYGRRRRYEPIRVSSSTGLARSYAGSSSA